MTDYTKEDMQRIAQIRQEIRAKADALPKEPSQGVMADGVDAFQHGLLSGTADLADGFNYLMGSTTARDAAIALRKSADNQIDQMSPEGREAFQNFGIESGRENITGLGFKEGSTARGFGLNFVSGLGSFAPTMVPGMGVAKTIGTAGKIASGVAKGSKVATTIDKASDVAGYAAAGSVAIGGSTGNQAYQKVATADFETLKDSEIFQERYWFNRDSKELSHEQALESTREELAKEIGNEAAKSGAALGAITQGALGPVFGKIFRGEAGGLVKATTTGGLAEGAQEFVESGGQTAAANTAVNPVIPTKVMDNVYADAATGAVIGGPVGGTMGAAGHAVSRKPSTPSEEDALLDQELGPADQIDADLAQIEDLMVENGDQLSEAEFEALTQARNALLQERARLTGEAPIDIDMPEAEQPAVQPEDIPQEPEILALPDQNIIYGDKPIPTNEQLESQRRHQAAFEAQHGVARNTGREGEYMPPENTGLDVSHDPGIVIDGEYSHEPKQLGNEGVTAIENQDIIYGDGPVTTKPEPRSDGLTDPYTGPQPSRRNDNPVYQEARRKLLERVAMEEEALRTSNELKQRLKNEKSKNDQVQLDGLETKQTVNSIKGSKTKAFTPSNKPIDLEYHVVEADDLITSNTDDLAPNPNYPQALQNRDRTTDSSQNQIRSMANGLIPEKLVESSDVSTGAPIVRNGIVESGNGRTLAIRKAYTEGNAEGYKAYLQKNAQRLGVNPEDIQQFKKPVLVRQRLTDMTPDELTSYTKDANTSEGQTLKPSEQAKSDASRLQLEDLGLLSLPESGDVAAPSNRAFIGKFLSRLTDNERAGLVGKDGSLTQLGATRLQNAIFAKAYQSDALIDEAADATTSDTKSVTNALVMAAPEFAKLNNEIPELTQTIVNAVSLIKKSRRDGVALQELTNQFDIEKGAPVDEGTAALSNFLDTNIRSAKRMSDGLSSLAKQSQSALANSRNEGLFGAAPEPTAQELIKTNEQIRQRTTESTAQTRPESTTQDASDSNGRSEQQREASRRTPSDSAGRVAQGNGEPQPKLSQSGKPFLTKGSARLSRTYKETPNAQIVPVEGGFGVLEGQESTKNLSDDIVNAANDTNTNPTDAQIQADNYKKGRVKLHGLDIAIENPKGSIRSGTDENGHKWESTMAHHYGDIKGVKSADGDDMDVFIGENPESEKVYVVNQVDTQSGVFDEHKVMMGFDSQANARQGYLANYEKNWQGLDSIIEMSTEDFKHWLKAGDTTKPLSRSATDTDVGTKQTYSLQDKIRNGETVTLDSIRESFESLASNPEESKAELNKLNKKQLMGMVSFAYSDIKKAALVDKAYRQAVQNYRFIGNDSNTIISSSYKFEDVINETRDHLAKLTQEKFDRYTKRIVDDAAKQQKEIDERVARVENPETLDDYRTAIQVKGRDGLTDQQLAEYDRLVAEKEMAEKPAIKQGLESDVTIELGEPIETTHGKTGETIFNVKPITRLGKDKFKESANFARSLGGGYYRGNFYFKSIEDAEVFSGWVNGEDVDLSQDKQEAKQAKKEKAAGRLKAMAERLEQQANESLNADRKENTFKRMNEGDMARRRAGQEIKTAAIMKAIADNENSVLKGLTQKAQVELMQKLKRQLEYNAPSELKETTSDGDSVFKADVSPETKIKYAKLPLIDALPRTIADVATKMTQSKGFVMTGRTLLSKAKKADKDKAVKMTVREFESLRKFIESNKEEFNYHILNDMNADLKRLERMGINRRPVLRAALLEFMDVESKAGLKNTEQSKLQQLERDLQRTIVGNRNAYNDFFPTPTETATEIVDLADIQQGMKVLEPSAGNGLLADAAKEAGGQVDAVEMADKLREILKEKGHNLIGDDFLGVTDGVDSYDRIVMNPPFSNDQDIQHVAHAFTKLKPGGRLVAIVSSMAGDRQNKRNQAFKQWLEDLGAETQALPENAFKSSLNPTSVRTKAIIIDKPEDGSINVPEEVKPPKEALFSLNQSNHSGMKADDVRAAVDPLIKELHQEGTFEVVQSVNDLPFSLRMQIKSRLAKSKGKNPTIRGINAGDKNYLIADGITSEKEAVQIFLHEVVGHKAVLDMLGKDGDAIMERIALSYGHKGLADLMKTYGADLKTKQGRILLGKEKVAHLAESNEKPTLLGKLTAAVRAWLRKYWPNLKWSDNDIHAMLSKAHKAMADKHFIRLDLDAEPKEKSSTSKANASVNDHKTIDDDKVNLSIQPDIPDDVDKIIQSTQSKPQSQKSLLDKAKEAAKRISSIDATELKQGFLDSYASIAALEKGENAGELLDASESAYKASLRTANLDSVMEVLMRKGALEIKDGAFQVKTGTKGLLEIFQPIADTGKMQLWETWAGARRAKRIMAEDTKANSDGIAALQKLRSEKAALRKTAPADFTGGLTAYKKALRDVEAKIVKAKGKATQKRERNYTSAQIKRVLDYVEGLPEEKASFNKAQKEWATFNKSVLDMAEQAGLIDPEARTLWENDDYVPFHRVSELEESPQGIRKRKGLSGQNSGVNVLTGGVEKLNILESMVRNTTHMVDASFKNIAMQRIVEVGDGIALEKIPSSKLAPEDVDRMLEEMGYSPNDMTPDQLALWANQLERYQSAGKGTVTVSNNGKAERYMVNDPLLLRAITQLGPYRVSGIMKILQIPKRLLTTLVTSDPAFMVANFVRDSLSTWVTVDAKTKPLVDGIRGAVKSLKRSEEQWAMMAAGAGGGGYYDTAPDNVRQHLSTLDKGGALHKPKELWDMWMRIGQASENANRIAVFESIMKDGGTVAEAAHQAQDVLNFSKRGEYAAVQALITVVPFMNARIQGLDRLVRGAKENPMGFMVKGAIITGATLALLAANWDNEEYWELEEWERDTYWHAWIDGDHIKIPKPFEVGALFATVPERAFEQLRQDASGKLLAERMVHMAWDTFAMNPTPQLFKPMLDIYANKNSFTGNPILGMGDEYRVPEAQYNPWTSKTVKSMAEAMPDAAPEWMRSPKRLEYALRGYFGTLGGYALGATDFVTQGLRDDPVAPELTTGQMPIVKRFHDDGVSSSKHIGRFYDMLNDVNSLSSTIKQFEKEGEKEKAKHLKTSNLKKLKIKADLARVGRKLGKINASIKAVYYQRNLTAKEKREKIDALMIQRKEVAREVSLKYFERF